MKNKLLVDSVRSGDRDRYFSALLAPSAVRDALCAVYAYDLALEDIVVGTSELQIGLIKLAWWRDAVLALSETPVAGQPVLEALSAIKGFDYAAASALADVRMDELEGDESAGADIESGRALFMLAGGVLMPAMADDIGMALSDAGACWARGNAVRRSGIIPDEAAMPRVKFASALRPLTALAALARRDLAGKHEARGSLGRQLSMLGHMITGRV